jgi:hypothetical protein
MNEFNLPKGKGRKLRVWVDELPALTIIDAPVKEIEFTVNGVTGSALHMMGALELFQPIGGSFRYGLLGAVFLPDSTGNLVIVVPGESLETNRCYAAALCGRLDRVIVGGTQEYALAIMQGVRKTQMALLPSGRLVFSAIAHSAVGSSPAIFEMLSNAIIRLLAQHIVARTVNEAAALLEEKKEAGGSG